MVPQKDKTINSDKEPKQKTQIAPKSSRDSKDPCNSDLQVDGPIEIPTSLNEELSEKIKDNPNKFIGCGG